MTSRERDPLIRLIAEDELAVYLEGAEQTTTFYVKSTVKALEISKITGDWFDFAVFHALCYLARRSRSTGLLYAITSVRELQKQMSMPDRPTTPSKNTVHKSLERLRQHGFVTLKLYNQKESLYVLHPRGGVHKFGSDQDTKEKLEAVIYDYERHREEQWNGTNSLCPNNRDANTSDKKETDILCTRIRDTETASGTQCPSSRDTRDGHCPSDEDTPYNIDNINIKETTTTTTVEPTPKDNSCGSSGISNFDIKNLYTPKRFKLNPENLPSLINLAGSKEVLSEALEAFDENLKKATDGTGPEIGDLYSYLKSVIIRKKEQSKILTLKDEEPPEKNEAPKEETVEEELSPEQIAINKFTLAFIRAYKDFPDKLERSKAAELFKQTGREPTPEEVVRAIDEQAI